MVSADRDWLVWTLIGTMASCAMFDAMYYLDDPEVNIACIEDLLDPDCCAIAEQFAELIEEYVCYYSNLDKFRQFGPGGH